MITRRDLEHHVMYDRARVAGTKLEHVMAVMLTRGGAWSSGLSS